MIPSHGPGSNLYAPAEPPPADGLLSISSDDLPVDILLPRLRGVRQSSANQWSACCPSHADGRASLSVTETDDGRLLVHCFAGCNVGDVMASVGLDMGKLYPSDYAVFQARRTGRRNQPAFDPTRPAVDSEPTMVPDEIVENLTGHARACFLAALADGRPGRRLVVAATGPGRLRRGIPDAPR